MELLKDLNGEVLHEVKALIKVLLICYNQKLKCSDLIYLMRQTSAD